MSIIYGYCEKCKVKNRELKYFGKDLICFECFLKIKKELGLE